MARLACPQEILEEHVINKAFSKHICFNYLQAWFVLSLIAKNFSALCDQPRNDPGETQQVLGLLFQGRWKTPKFESALWLKEWTGKMIYLDFSSIFGDFFLKFFEEEVSDYLS